MKITFEKVVDVLEAVAVLALGIFAITMFIKNAPDVSKAVEEHNTYITDRDACLKAYEHQWHSGDISADCLKYFIR